MDEWITAHGIEKSEKLVYEMMAGRLEEDPICTSIAPVIGRIAELMASAGISRPLGRRRKERAIDFGMLYMLGQYLEDPDYTSMSEMIEGVRIGVGVTLPRIKALASKGKMAP